MIQMITYRYVISDKQGLHARNAITFSRAAAEYESSVQLSVDGGKTADGKNVISLMNLGTRQGDTLVLKVEGTDEEQASGFLQGLLRTIA